MTLLPEKSKSSSSNQIWLLTGDKLGDNAQLELIGNHLEKEYSCIIEKKHIVYNQKHKRSNLLHGKSTKTINHQKSDSIVLNKAPDLILFSGRRAVPVALWIKNQSKILFNKNVRLVAIGKPRAPFFWFDLIVSTRQYRLPSWIPNLIINDFTLNRAECLQSENFEKSQYLDNKRNCIIFLGGERSGFIMRDKELTNIVNTIRLFKEKNPSYNILIFASKSTPRRAVDYISTELLKIATFFTWDSPIKPSYKELLCFGDVFFTTEDSASVITETVSTNKKVYLLPLFQKQFANKIPLLIWLKRVKLLAFYPFGLYNPNREMRAFSSNLVNQHIVQFYNQQDDLTQPKRSNQLEKELTFTLNSIMGLLEKPK